MDKYFQYQLEKLRARPLDKWGQARGAENILVIHWFTTLRGMIIFGFGFARF